MHRWLICIILSICFFLGSHTARTQSDPISEVIRLVKELRVSFGLPAYQVDVVLMSVAQAQASWSAANNHIGHDGQGGSSPDDRAQAVGYETGEVDDSLFTYEPMDFSVGLGFPAITKIALAVVLLIAAGLAWLVYRIVRRIVRRKATPGGIRQ